MVAAVLSTICALTVLMLPPWSFLSAPLNSLVTRRAAAPEELQPDETQPEAPLAPSGEQ